MDNRSQQNALARERLSDYLYYEDPYGVLYCGDCREVMPLLSEKSIDIVITDPVWPDEKMQIAGSDDPWGLWASALDAISGLTERLVVQLSCCSDPRFLMAVPPNFRFVRVCWLRYLPPRYRGNILDGADVAYVFGDGKLPEGRRVLGGEVTHVSRPPRSGVKHPCFRPYKHTEFLVASFTKSTWLVLDPFAGSGTTLLACKRSGRKFIGIEIEERHCEEARQRLAQEVLALEG